jgi:hypothetical protein
MLRASSLSRSSRRAVARRVRRGCASGSPFPRAESSREQRGSDSSRRVCTESCEVRMTGEPSRSVPTCTRLANGMPLSASLVASAPERTVRMSLFASARASSSTGRNGSFAMTLPSLLGPTLIHPRPANREAPPLAEIALKPAIHGREAFFISHVMDAKVRSPSTRLAAYLDYMDGKRGNDAPCILPKLAENRLHRSSRK